MLKEIKRLFGIKEEVEMYDMAVYWAYDVNMDDLMEDLNWIGDAVCKSHARTGKSGIMTVRTEWIDGQPYRMASLYVDGLAMTNIQNKVIHKKMKAARFVEVSV